MLGRIGKGESILNEHGKEFNGRNRFKTATCKKNSLWCGLEYFSAGLEQAGRSLEIQPERGVQGGHTGFSSPQGSGKVKF